VLLGKTRLIDNMYLGEFEGGNCIPTC